MVRSVLPADGAAAVIIMRHPSGTIFRHRGTLLEKLIDWRVWWANYRHGYRFGIEL
jgi:hypothetical protein